MPGYVDMGMSVCGDPYCSGCELDLENDDEDDDDWYDAEYYETDEDDDFYDGSTVEFSILTPPLTKNDLDEEDIPF